MVLSHHAAYLRVRAAVTRTVGAAWGHVSGVDDAALDRWLNLVVPIAQAGRSNTAALAVGFLQTAGINASDGLPEIRGGLALEEVYARPIIAARTALSNGVDFASALGIGGTRAETIASTDVMLANRGGMALAEDDGIIGWERVLSGNGCAFCAEVEGAMVGSADAMPLHDNCDCDVVPVLGRRNPVREINRDVLDSLSGPNLDDHGLVVRDGEIVHGETGDRLKVAIHEHGELGAVLADASHAFAGPADVAN